MRGPGKGGLPQMRCVQATACGDAAFAADGLRRGTRPGEPDPLVVKPHRFAGLAASGRQRKAALRAFVLRRRRADRTGSCDTLKRWLTRQRVLYFLAVKLYNEVAQS